MWDKKIEREREKERLFKRIIRSRKTIVNNREGCTMHAISINRTMKKMEKCYPYFPYVIQSNYSIMVDWKSFTSTADTL